MTDGWRGEAPEEGLTIREREDREMIVERAVELGGLDEKVEPARFLRWLDGRGYYVSDQWRRALLLPETPVETIPDRPAEKEAQVIHDLKLELQASEERADGLEQDLAKAKSEHRLQAVLERQEATASEAKLIGKLKKELRMFTEGPISPTDKAALARNRATLQRALIAAAVDAYGYDPRAARSDWTCPGLVESI